MGLSQFKWDLEKKVRTKRSLMKKRIIPDWMYKKVLNEKENNSRLDVQKGP